MSNVYDVINSSNTNQYRTLNKKANQIVRLCETRRHLMSLDNGRSIWTPYLVEDFKKTKVVRDKVITTMVIRPLDDPT